MKLFTTELHNFSDH